MFDPAILKLTNMIARGGIDEGITGMIIPLFDTILSVENFEEENSITNLQTLLLLLQGYEIPPAAKRLVDELRHRIVRRSLGRHWMHGLPTMDYSLTETNKGLVSKNEVVQVYEDGFVERSTTFSIQPPLPSDMWILNDMGAAALNN